MARPTRRAALTAISGSATAAALVACGAPATPPSERSDPSSPQAPAAVPTAPPAPTPTAVPVVIPPGDQHFGVNEGFSAAAFANQLGARWTRWIVEWSEVYRGGPDDFNDFYVDANVLRETQRYGYKVMAVLKSTPEWARSNPEHGVRSVPKGLDLPFNDPDNAWGRTVLGLARYYKDRIDTWAIWNEVEIPATGPNAVYNTWAGSLEQYYRLLKVASQAAKSVNPNARIILSPYSYHRDKEWLTRFLKVATADPEGAANGYFFDVVGLNLYRNPHDIYDRKMGGVPWAAEASDRIGIDERLAQFSLKKPIWATEINAMPYDDKSVEGWDPTRRNDGFRITLDEQANFVLQAYALGIAAGYESIFWQAMQDDKPPVPDELWGLVRWHGDPANADPARVRPSYTAYQVATRYLSGAEKVTMANTERADPANYRAYATRYTWWIHHMAFRKGTRRTAVLWNGAGTAARVTLPKLGTSAKLVDKAGAETELAPQGDRWVVPLAAATRHFNLFGGDPPGYFYIGGSPVLLVEEGVPPEAPVSRPTVI